MIFSMLKNIINKIKFKKDPVGFSRAQGVLIGHDCQILGSKFPFGSEPYLISIGNHVRINAGCQFFTHDGGAWTLRGFGNVSNLEIGNSNMENLKDVDLFGTIEIGNNVQISSNVIILPRVKIGDNCIIGAGAIVTRDMPDGMVCVGVPCKPIETVQEYYEKNKNRIMHTKGLSPDEKRKILETEFQIHV